MRVVLCNCPADQAAQIALHVVEKRLAACVNAVPGVSSTYWWAGEICVDQETMLIMKTRAELVTELVKAVVKVHPYDVPEVISLPILEGHGPYLAWVADETKVPSSTP